jgi:DNA-binding CsgD family transcriptional regulator
VARLTGLVAGPARHTLVVTFAMPDLAEAAATAGREDVALAALARFEEFSAAAGQPWAEGVALRCHALLGHDPEVNFERAVRLHVARSRPFERARTELAYARWLRRARRRSDARVQLTSALTIFSQLGAGQWAAQARGELRAAGATPPAGAGQADPAVRLTAQELQVVRRAAAGLSNREIAAELFLSPRTVGYHLYKAYPKLGVTTRTQLATLSQDLGR